jgi:SAM-dependent methyltransferase
VLELGAGTGRATAFLARSAARVVAFDLSLEMVAIARRKLAGQSHVTLFVADLRDLALDDRFDLRFELRFDLRFDLVVAVDDPFSHLTGDDDRARAFAAAARHLAPGGRFLLDAAWLSPRAREKAAGPEGLVRERATGKGPGGEGLVVRQVWRCDPESRVCTARFEYRIGNRTAEEASFPARLWSLGELRRRARANGLAITALWGGYDRRPWMRSTSSRLIAELRAGR